MAQRYIGITRGNQPLAYWKTGALLTLLAGMLSVLLLWPGSSLLERLHWLDSGICAQLPTHSFYPGGQILPLCARNTGIYLGFMVTLLLLYATRHSRAQRFPRRPVAVLLLCGVVAMAVDGLNSLELDLGMPHLYQPQNIIRLLTGLVSGLGLAIFMLPWLNRFLWREDSRQRSIASWPMLLPYLSALVVCYLAVTAQSALVVYPIALLSTAGLLVAVGSFNLLIIVGIKKRDETFTGYRALLPYVILALLCATGELLALAQLKFMLLRLVGPMIGL